MVIDRHNRACDRRLASLDGHHDCQYIDVTTVFTNLFLLQLFLKQYLPNFQTANQISLLIEDLSWH